MNNADKIFLNLLQDIVDNGYDEPNSRTGIGTRALFCREIRFKMQEGFPLLTTKKMYSKGIIYENLWFLGNHLNDPNLQEFGRTNAKFLIDNNVNIWVGDLYKRYKTEYLKERDQNNLLFNEWLEDNGILSKDGFTPLQVQPFIEKIKSDRLFAKRWAECGPIYGAQWTSWVSHRRKGTVINQLKNAIEKLKTNPTDRRIMVSAWNVDDIENGKMVLPPCHYGYTFFTRLLTLEERIDLASKEKWFDPLEFGVGPQVTDEHCHKVCDSYKVPRRALSLKWNQRSVDTALGLPFNIASYALLLEMVAKEVGMLADELIGSLENVHIYHNQLDGVKEQLSRDVKYPLPTVVLNSEKSIFEYEFEDIKIVGYQSDSKIDFPLSN